jgi:hypothetical protein
MKTKHSPDVRVERHGLSVFLFTPETSSARRWIKKNVLDAIWLGGALAVDARCAMDLSFAMQEDGLSVR